MGGEDSHRCAERQAVAEGEQPEDEVAGPPDVPARKVVGGKGDRRISLFGAPTRSEAVLSSRQEQIEKSSRASRSISSAVVSVPPKERSSASGRRWSSVRDARTHRQTEAATGASLPTIREGRWGSPAPSRGGSGRRASATLTAIPAACPRSVSARSAWRRVFPILRSRYGPRLAPTACYRVFPREGGRGVTAVAVATTLGHACGRSGAGSGEMSDRSRRRHPGADGGVIGQSRQRAPSPRPSAPGWPCGALARGPRRSEATIRTGMAGAAREAGIISGADATLVSPSRAWRLQWSPTGCLS